MDSEGNPRTKIVYEKYAIINSRNSPLDNAAALYIDKKGEVKKKTPKHNQKRPMVSICLDLKKMSQKIIDIYKSKENNDEINLAKS